jgi:hypothetical protein
MAKKKAVETKTDENGVMWKKCTKCDEFKVLNDFHKRKDSGDGRRSNCIACSSSYNKERYDEKRDVILQKGKEYRKENKEHYNSGVRKRRAENKEGVKKTNRRCYVKNAEKRKQSAKEYRMANPDKCKESCRSYSKTHRNTINVAKHNYYHNVEKHKPHIMIKKALRTRIKTAFKKIGLRKNCSATEHLGCSDEELKLHFENLFYDRFNGEKMTWENHGTYGWHIDHIKPLSSFDLTDPEQVKLACYYTNLQPLWAEDNLKKGDTLNKGNTNE